MAGRFLFILALLFLAGCSRSTSESDIIERRAVEIDCRDEIVCGDAAIECGDAAIEAVALSPDCKTIAKAERGEIYEIYLVDVVSGRKKAIAQEVVTDAMAFSPDGKSLAIRWFKKDDKKCIKIYEVATVQERLAIELDYKNTARAMVFSPKGNYLAAAFLGDNCVQIWNIASQKIHGVLRADSHAVGALAFSPDEKTLVWGDGRLAKFWDMENRREVKRIQYPDVVGAVAFSADGTALALFSGDGVVQVINKEKVRKYNAVDLHIVWPWPSLLEFSADGQLVAVGMNDGVVHVWDYARERVKTFQGSGKADAAQYHSDTAPFHVGFENSSTVLLAYRDATVKRRNLADIPWEKTHYEDPVEKYRRESAESAVREQLELATAPKRIRKSSGGELAEILSKLFHLLGRSAPAIRDKIDTDSLWREELTADGRVTITAYLPFNIPGVTVYFEVIDPDDASPYAEDTTPATPYRSGIAGNDIDGVVPGGANDNAAPNNGNDNRDQNKTMYGGTLAVFDQMQKNSLSSREAVTVLRMINGVQRAVAEVELTVTDRFAGDNYQVRATTRSPLNVGARLPFNAATGLNAGEPHKNIAPTEMAQSAVFTAWWRIYYEMDTMYRKGSLLAKNAKAGDTELIVENADNFVEGRVVRIFDSVTHAALGEELTVTKVTYKRSGYSTGGVIEFTNSTGGNSLIGSYVKSNMAFLGVQSATGYHARDYFIPNVSGLASTFDDVYLEVVQLPNDGGSERVPLVVMQKDNGPTGRDAFTKMWFDNRNRNNTAAQGNYFYLVGAKTGDVPGGLGRSDSKANWSFINVGQIESTPSPGPIATRNAMQDTVNHEIVHQFDIYPADLMTGGHDTEKAWDNGDQCLMDEARVRGDNNHKLGLEHIYKLRDFPTWI